MQLRRFLFLLFAAFAFALGPPGFSEKALAQSLAKTFTLTAANQCASIGVTSLPTIGIQITGTFSATLQPEVAINGQAPQNTQVKPSTSSTAQSTITAAGVYKAAVGGYDTFALCVSSYASGTATVQLNPSNAINAELFDSGGTVASVSGTRNQVDVTPGNTPVISIDPSFVAPGTASFLQKASFPSNAMISPTLNTSITNIAETSGSVVTLTVSSSSFAVGQNIFLAGLTTGTWLNAQTATLIAPTNATTLTFNDPTLNGTQASHSESGTVTTGGLTAGSAFIDPTTAVLTPNTTAPFLAAGSYTVSAAITDGNGNWSNLVSYTITADGSHNYAVSWNPPTTWWSQGTGASGFSSTFTNNANVAAWVSFNGGAIQSITSATGGTLGFLGYSFWQPYVRFGGGYTGGSTPIPTLNTLPAINLTAAGPSPQITGAALIAPTMGAVNLSQEVNIGSPSGQGFTINDPPTGDTTFLNPFSQGGYLLFEQKGIGTGALIFNSGGTKGLITLDAGNNGSGFTGALNFALGASLGQPTIANPPSGTPTITWPTTTGTLADSATSPLVLNSTTGVLTCPTCQVTGSILTGTNTQRLNADSSGITATTPGTVVFTWGALPVSTKFSFSCELLYSQATAAVLDGLAVQSATNAATRWDAWGTMYTTDPVTTTVVGSQNSALNVTSTTATPIVTATPAATGTVYQARVAGTIQGGASAPTLNILAFTGNASDALTIKAGSFCTLTP